MARTKAFKLNRIILGALISVLLSGSNVNSYAQNSVKRLPFRMTNNLIILSARINGSDTLNFILDTGLKNSILCELSAGETLELEEAREIRVQGLGVGVAAEAIHSTGNVLELGGMSFPDQDFVVLSNNILQLSNKMGTRIHGLLSMQAFYDYVVEIDYDRRYISIIPPGLFKDPGKEKFSSLPLHIESGKPFLVVRVTTHDGLSFPVKLLLDSGASNAIWLDINSLEGFVIPENARHCHLGCGISGDVQGLMSRVERVDIGPHSLSEVLVSYPDSLAIANKDQVPGRNGSLGSEIIKRFDVILDFPGRKIHLNPNRDFSRKFHYDMSGIEVMAEVPDQPAYIISRVREGSAAQLAGVRAGDRIMSINSTPVREYSMDGIYRKLEGAEGKKVRLIVLRGDEKLKLSFQLEEYI